MSSVHIYSASELKQATNAFLYALPVHLLDHAITANLSHLNRTSITVGLNFYHTGSGITPRT